MKMHILDLGRLELDSNRLVDFSTLATNSNKEAKHEWIDIPIWAMLIEHEEALIMYDCGCIQDAMESDVWPEFLKDRSPYYHTPEQTVPAQLAKLGYSAKDVEILIASHTHIDHFGNIGLFAHADVYAPMEDWLRALTITHQYGDKSRHGSFIKADYEVPVKEYHLISIGEDFELLPGIDIITLPGHAANILGMVLHFEKDGTIIIPNDAAAREDVMGPPIKFSGNTYDSLSFANSVEKVRRLQKKYKAQIFYAHSKTQFATLKHFPDYYE